MAKKKQITKDELIDKEVKRLTALFQEIDEKKLKTVKSLIENAAFMTITLDELQKQINIKGCVEEYQNGANQKGYKKCSEVEVYNTMIKNHTTIMKQLAELLPKDNAQDESDGFDEFVGGRGD